MKSKSKYEIKCRLKKGDEVMVMVGKAKGETGKIDHIDYKHGRLFVSGLNIYKRHTRPDGANQEGGIVDKVMPMNWSNVQLMDPKEKKPTRVGYREENGRKVRFAKASGTVLEG